MTYGAARILTYHGSCDGIRFGDLFLSGGGQRHFLLDRLNGTVKLYQTTRWDNVVHTSERCEDTNPAHQAEALAMLRGRP